MVELNVDVKELEGELLKVLSRDYEVHPDEVYELSFRLVNRAVRLDGPKDGVKPIYVITTEFICYTK